MLTLLLVLAATPIIPERPATLAGWSNDGEAIVWLQTEKATSPAHHYFEKTGKKAEVPMETVMAMPAAARNTLTHRAPSPDDESSTGGPGPMQVDEEATVAVVHHVKTDVQEKYLLAYTALTPQAGGLKKRLSTLANLAAFEAWKKANGPVVKKGLDGPSGAKATVLIAGKQSLTWTPTAAMTIAFVVTRGADKSVVTMDDDAEASFISERSTEVFWDPSGRRALFAMTIEGSETIRGTVDPTAEYFIVATPPRVEVLAPARLKAEADRVAGVVEKAGFAVVAVGPATKDRAATVIYAGPAHQDAAQKLAAALPGATVDKLTWKANGELVVAVGAAAK